MIKRFLSLGFGSWEKRRQRGTYLRYYIENPEDDRNILARWLDFLSILLVTWLLGFILLSGITKTLQALLFSAALLAIGLAITDIVKRKQLRQKLLHTRLELNKQSYLEKMERMKEREFFSFATGLLEKYGIQFTKENISIDLKEKIWEGTFKEKPVWIKLFADDNKVTPAAMKKLINNLTAHDFTAGIVIIKGKVSPEVQHIIELERNKMYVEVLDRNRLAQMAASLENITLSRSLADEFSQLKKRQEQEKRKLLLREIIGSRQKTISFILSGVLLLVLSFFWQNTALSLVYAFFGMANISLAVISFVLERQKARAQLLKP